MMETRDPRWTYHQETLLDRFERLLIVSAGARDDLTEEGIVLFERCIVATYGDCCEAGCGEEADRMARMMGAKI